MPQGGTVCNVAGTKTPATQKFLFSSVLPRAWRPVTQRVADSAWIEQHGLGQGKDQLTACLTLFALAPTRTRTRKSERQPRVQYDYGHAAATRLRRPRQGIDREFRLEVS
jgi:hypothetical protein